MEFLLNDLLIMQFAKWPVLGNVKTRLACSVGDEKALQVHMLLMQEVLSTLIAAKQQNIGDVELWVNKLPKSQGLMTSVMQQLNKTSICCKRQKGHNLGDKMADAINTSLGAYKKVIIVGSDCPNISLHTLREASHALNDNDIVLGPAEDGGYVLIGASNFNPDIFIDVAWGEGKVLETTIKNINKLNLSYYALKESWDVDDLEDYKRWSNL